MSSGLISVHYGFFAYSCECNFMNTSVFFVTVFVEDVNFLVGARATTNSNDSAVLDYLNSVV